MKRANASFASMGVTGGHGALGDEPIPVAEQRVRIRIVRPNCSSGAPVSGMLFPSDELIFAPSHETRIGVVSTTCGSSPYASITSRPASRL